MFQIVVELVDVDKMRVGQVRVGNLRRNQFFKVQVSCCGLEIWGLHAAAAIGPVFQTRGRDSSSSPALFSDKVHCVCTENIVCVSFSGITEI